MTKSPKSSIKRDRHTIALTNIDKVLLPPNITKGNIISYYDMIADTMLPYLKDRALMMQRFPEGLSGEMFYQKDASDYFPDWIKRAKIPKVGGYNNFVVCQNAATLIYLANLACITPHLWLSRIDKLHFPDRLIFDLDPSGSFDEVRFIALTIKKLFDVLQLTTYVMTTGSRGLHVIIPIDRRHDFHAVKNFAHACAMKVIEAFPDKATLEIRKEKRGKKVFIDILRNQYGSTAVAPYAIRARPKAPVATPLHWDEVEDKSLSPQKYTISNIGKRLKSIKDPWQDFFKTRQSLTDGIQALSKKT